MALALLSGSEREAPENQVNRRMYNVTVDRAAMREEVLGPLFQRHVVSLTGTVDDRWLASYGEVAKDSEIFQRYRLEPDKGTISFTCRASDGPTQVESFLDRLALFVEMVNLHATCATADSDPGTGQEALSA
jgi:hypothetical protein